MAPKKQAPKAEQKPVSAAFQLAVYAGVQLYSHCML